MARLTFKNTITVAMLLMVAYTIIRAALVWRGLNGYGVNPWVFLALDVITAPPYVWGVGKMIQGLRGVDRMRAVYIGGVVALVAFMLPYTYVFIAGNATMPMTTKVVVGAIVVVLFGAGPLREVIRKVKSGKACGE